MSRKPTFSLAYSHERAFASQMAQAFASPSGIPARMQAVLDQLDAPCAAAQRSLVGRLDAIRHLTQAEAADDQATPRSR